MKAPYARMWSLARRARLRGRRPQHDSTPAAPLAERPPRLVLRFAVVTALCLSLGAAAILIFTRHLNTVEAERHAAEDAKFLVESVLLDELGTRDLASPVTAARREQLDALFERKVLNSGTLAVTLSRRDLVVTYATDHSLIGRKAASAERTRDALDGNATSDVSTIRGEGDERVKVLRSAMPVSVGDRSGVVTVYQDYGPIAASAREALLPIAGILELVLALMFVLLVPLLARVSRRLHRYVQRIEYQSLHDELTGLPNRLSFRRHVDEALEQARREGGSAAVVVLDLDRFQEINETLGHESGDGLLRSVADRLGTVAGDGVLLARLGADQFAYVAQGATPGAVALAERARGALDGPFVVRDVPLLVEASAGVAVFPENGDDGDALLQSAVASMHLAKDRRLGMVLSEGARDSEAANALALVSELKPALARGELILHYQPKLSLATGRIIGAEALVRWEHPERGLLQPFAFIPYVERTAASRALSAYVLDLAARQVRAWRESGLEVDVAVNLTMFDLLDTELPSKVASVLEASGAEPEWIELEITESVIMGDPERVRSVVSELKQLGVRLAIDDFGTGYSSLSYLKTLQVDVLKIDRSFVMAMDGSESDRAIVRSTIDLAHNLGLTVVAEGVDNASVLDELAEYGCELAQGFHIARPCAPDAFEAAVASFGDDRDAVAAVA
jgi:diguanylate cyclase